MFPLIAEINQIHIFLFGMVTLQWGDLFKSFVVEANWYQSGHIPTLEEYLENGCISISGPVILMHVHSITSISSTQEIMQCMEISKDIVRYSSLIFRLTDDLGTSSV